MGGMDTDGIEKTEGHQIATSEAGRLNELQRRVGQWRRTRERRTRVPEELWVDAIWLAKRLGVYRTARAVGLLYESLKNRVGEGRSAHAKSKASRGHGTISRTAVVTSGMGAIAHGDQRVGFFEFGHVGAASPVSAAATVVEVADGSGRRLTVRLGAGMAIDVAGVLAAFGSGPSRVAIAQQFERGRHPRIRQAAQDQWRHPQ